MSVNSSGSPSGTGTGAATVGSREDAADAGAGGAGGAVMDVVLHSVINWNVGNPDGDNNTSTDNNKLKSKETADVPLLALPDPDWRDGRCNESKFLKDPADPDGKLC